MDSSTTTPPSTTTPIKRSIRSLLQKTGSMGKSVVSVGKNTSSKVKSIIPKSLLIVIFFALGIFLVFIIWRAIRIKIKSRKTYSSKVISSSQDGTVTTVIKSKDINDGQSTMPYSWTVWLYVDKMNFIKGGAKYIFIRQNGPYVFLDPKKNDIRISFKTKKSAINMGNKKTGPTTPFEVKIENIPMNKWFHMGLIVNTNEVETYLNGRLVKTSLLTDLSLLDSAGDVSVNPLGGFIGKIQSLNFYATAIQPQTVYFNYRKEKGLQSTSKWKKSLSNIENKIENNLSQTYLSMDIPGLTLPGGASLAETCKSYIEKQGVTPSPTQT